MKGIRRSIMLLGTISIVTLMGFSGVASLIWQIGTKTLPDDAGLGYYRDFNLARKAVKQSGCADSIDYGRHEDFALEDFHFRVCTKSGRIILIFFHEAMNVQQVCNNPKGILVLHPWHLGGNQGYSTESLSQLLRGRGFEVRNIKDVLCNLDEMIPLFEANYANESIPVIRYKDEEFREYVHIRIMREGEKEFFSYSK
jgi:hypothetical protein